MTVFDINKFKAQTASGFTRTNFFIVQITAPKSYTGNAEFLQFLCSSAQLPGITIGTSSQQIWGYGPAQNIPIGANFSPINLTFYSDGDGKALSFFNDWTQSIVAYGSKNEGYKGVPYAELAYPSQYYTDIDILYYTPVGNDPYLACYHLSEAFPMGIAPINVSWASQGQLAQIVVPISYRNFKYIPNLSEGGIVEGAIANPESISTLPGGAKNVTGPFIGLNGILQGFTSILQTVGGGIGSILNAVSSLNNMAEQVIRPISMARTISSEALNLPSTVIHQIKVIPRSIL